MAKNVSTIKINATRQRVWDILTQPVYVKLWQYGSDLVTNWAVGSDIRFRTEWEGKIFEQWGKVLAFKPENVLQYSLYAPRPGLEDKPENYSIMNYVLTEENGLVKLQIIQEDNRPNAVQEEPQNENPVLNSLKQIAETEP
ncbi:MAG: SRPBCC domain-containing protein [Chitinophagales bacterium]|nr:SRPBCC domain-containing protein [Chitinophagales bacterium]